MAKCQLCGKSGHSGNNVSHSKRRTKTRFMPNVQRTTIVLDGKVAHVSACTRCIRTQSKPSRFAVA